MTNFKCTLHVSYTQFAQLVLLLICRLVSGYLLRSQFINFHQSMSIGKSLALNGAQRGEIFFENEIIFQFYFFAK